MNILISAPSLNPSKNVSGVSTMVNTVIKHNKKHHYFHYLLGRSDQNKNRLIIIITLIKQLIFFPVFLHLNKIVIVHQNLPFDPKGVLREYIINLWCRLTNVPVILHIHGGLFITQGTKNILYKGLILSLFKHSKQVIVLSELEQIVLKEKFSFTKTKVLSNCIDTSIYNNRIQNLLTDQPTLLYLGRIEKNKGIIELVEALELLKKDFIFRFILCGTGPLVQHCITECERILENNFEYKGVVSGESKLNEIENSDIFILPSYFEGLPMALLETMASGVVPVVTNVGSMKQIIKHGSNGLHVKKQDAQDLFDKLKYLLSNPKLYLKLSKNAKQTVLQKYDIKNYIIELNQIYETSMKVKIK